MSFVRLSSEYNLSSYTLVDNVFLHEIMPGCPEGHLKVYLMGLYLAATPAQNTLDYFCSRLSMTEEQVFEAFKYFEEYSLVSILSRTPLTVCYAPVSGHMSKPRKIKPQKYTEFTKQVQALLPGRMISTAEFAEYFNLIETYKLQQEALILIIKYCTMIKDTSISYRYISAVAKNWAARGITTLDACERELAAFNSSTAEITEIYKAMGLRGGADFYDSERLAKWKEELGFPTPSILAAARTLRGKRPTMEKLDALLLEYFRNKKFSKEEIADYESHKAALKDTAVSVNRALGVYVADLTPVMETYITPWTDAGFLPDTLKTIAGYCFKVGIKTLEGMDAFVKKLVREGVISQAALDSFIERQVARESLLRKMLLAAGIEREVNTYDRANYRVWSELWGMPDDVIMLAAQKSVGLSPIKTMHRLLSYYRENGAFTLQSAEKLPAPGQYQREPVQRAKNYGQHDYSREDLSGLFDDIEDIGKL